VDCFSTLGVSALIAPSYGAIYERNAINSGMPIMSADILDTEVQNGHTLTVDFASGTLKNESLKTEMSGEPFSDVQLRIYQQGGLLG